MSRATNTAKSGSKTEVIDNFKQVKDRLESLVLKLNDLSQTEYSNKEKKSPAKRETFFRELNQMRNDVITNVNEIQRQIEANRPMNTDESNFIDAAQNYLLLIQFTKEILEKLNRLFAEIFDRFSDYIEQLWNSMIDHDQQQIQRLTREFYQFFQEKTSNSNQLLQNIQQLINDIHNTQTNSTLL